MKSNTSLQFGKYLLDDLKLKKLLSKSTYNKYIHAKTYHRPLKPKTLNALLKAIMAWATSEGATHYAHIFYPLFRPSAEKGVAFLSSKNGKITNAVPLGELMASEVDTSSFPNGYACPPHKAKGYAIWDITPPPYIVCTEDGDKTLYLPSKFFSNDDISLDNKTPLTRAIDVVNKEAKRLLKMLKINTKEVICNVGAEQEFFLLKKDLFESRYDLFATSHTLIDSTLTPLQKYNNHYLSKPSPQITRILDEVTHKLWNKGITAKIRHSEVAPSQYEITTIFGDANIICDQNSEIMHIINAVADRFGYTALFHEKPVSNTNGSGKHINLSFCTKNGLNLFNPNTSKFHIFYVFFTAFIVAIDTHKDLIINSTNTYANSLRLGQKEAPPSSLTIHIGEGLTQKLLSFDPKNPNKAKADKLTDNRNRTSPLAFVKNRFEFRMLGSSESIAPTLTYIYIAFSNTLKHIADKAKKTKGNKTKAILEISKALFEKHANIIYNGNNYQKAQSTTNNQNIKVSNLSPEAIKNAINLGVFNESELALRQTAQKQKYLDDLMSDCVATNTMLNKYIFPSLIGTLNFYKKCPQTPKGDDTYKQISTAIDNLFDLQNKLLDAIEDTNSLDSVDEKLKWLIRFGINILSDIATEYKKIKDLIPRSFETFPSVDEVFKNQ